eukprot:3940483-Rhodomonas_salina.1
MTHNPENTANPERLSPPRTLPNKRGCFLVFDSIGSGAGVLSQSQGSHMLSEYRRSRVLCDFRTSRMPCQYRGPRKLHTEREVGDAHTVPGTTL